MELGAGLTPVILTTLKVEIGRIVVQGQTRQKFHKTSSLDTVDTPATPAV
jgi:hypothetical protein